MQKEKLLKTVSKNCSVRNIVDIHVDLKRILKINFQLLEIKFRVFTRDVYTCLDYCWMTINAVVQ